MEKEDYKCRSLTFGRDYNFDSYLHPTIVNLFLIHSWILVVSASDSLKDIDLFKIKGAFNTTLIFDPQAFSTWHIFK